MPETHDTATSDIAFLSANATRKLLALPGGDLSLALGLDWRLTHENNPGQPYALQGDSLMDGSFYARGSQTVSAAFVEMVAPVLDNLELDAAGRVDHYNSSAGTAATPKLGFKYTPIPQFAVRGTFARGFRAPSIAESGHAGSASSVAPAPVDPIRCVAPYTSVQDCGLPGSAVAVLTQSNPQLKPETSTSYTFGVIAEPFKHNALTVDYFYIRRDREIAPAPYDPSNAIRTPAAPGSSLPGTIIEYLTPYGGHRRRLEDAVRSRRLRRDHHDARRFAPHPVPANLRRCDLSLRGHGGTDRAQRIDRHAGQPGHPHHRLEPGSLVLGHDSQLP